MGDGKSLMMIIFIGLIVLIVMKSCMVEKMHIMLTVIRQKYAVPVEPVMFQ